ncbi:cell division cycle-associated protein 7-like [Hylaeus anthracinus]|uniref:cell division cycle-associated protein 7-like n=1 Tax=Hylaeus anthracinus TaxID=313031 RepID=UPI0023B9480F|nr:cell division cycle-associated protein 7-like [Hylaeus anthracinus]
MSEDNYDELRRKNIAERNAFFAEVFKDFKKQTNEIEGLSKKYKSTDNLENEPPKKRRRTVSGAIYDDNFKINRVQLGFRRKYNTRSRVKNLSKDDSNTSKNEEEKENDDDLDKPRRNRSKLQVLFSWAKPMQRSIDLMNMGVCDVDQEEEQYSDDDDDDGDDDDDDDSFNYTKKKRVYKVSKTPYDPNNIPSVDEITDKMLNNVAEKSSLKTYSSINGTSCHQCRQKTLDTKTVCRSGECVGVRGQFCGPCLRGRYGESAVEALKDPNWACPPCRGLCNCSICRTRSGLRPTGILAPVVQEEGYSSVMDYLNSTDIDKT